MIPKFKFFDKGYSVWLHPDQVWLDEKGAFRGVEGVTRFEPVGGDLVVMQSTGLKDKNGVEIFEGDVVKRTSLIPGGADLVGVVKMLEGCWVIDDGNQAIAVWTEVDENIVIGSIYENHEMVEVE